MSDITGVDLFEETVKSFGRPFRGKAMTRLFTAPTILPSLLDSLIFDIRDREMADQLAFFTENWSRIRRFPNFSVLYLCVLVSLHIPDRHEALFHHLVELTTQPLIYSIPYIRIVLPLIFVYFSEATHFVPLAQALFARFSPDELIPTFCQCLYYWPDTFSAYSFLRNLTSTFGSFSPDMIQLLSSTFSLLKPTDSRIEPFIAAISDQLAFVRETASPRSRLALSPNRSLGPSASVMVSNQLLNGYLDQIESGMIEDDQPSIMQHLASHFRKHPFPDRPFRPVMEFSLRMWAAHEQPGQVLIVANCRDVLKAIHAVTSHAREIYTAYDEFSVNPELKGVAEFAYEEFRRSFPDGTLPDGTKLPYSLEKSAEIDKRGQLAIQEMRKLTTAYDGVMHMWELLKWAPNYDLVTPFRKFNTAQKCFLVSGFRLKAREDTSEGREQRLRLIEELEGLLRTPRPTAEREASESSERMTQRKLAEERRLLTPQRRPPRAAEWRTLTPVRIRGSSTVIDGW
jgi:hypothetical protein